MTATRLDAIFPWFVFAYGTLVTLALGSDRLKALGARLLPEQTWQRLCGHRHLATACLAFGALWILQDLYFG